MAPDDAGPAPAYSQSGETRREIAASAVAQLLAGGFIDEADREAAHAIVEELSRDAETRVRRQLAEIIAHYDLLPRRTAERLARDVEEVAVPVIARSPVLEDEFLISLVQEAGTSEAKQIAVAQRPCVPPHVSHALVTTENANVVGALLVNNGAELAGHSLAKAMEDHRDKPLILRLLAERPEATPEIAAACRSLTVDDELEQTAALRMREILMEQHGLPLMLAHEMTQAALERAITDHMTDSHDEAEMAAFVERLHGQARLTPTLLLRGLCLGHTDFFALAMAVLTGTSHKEVEAALAQEDASAFNELYAKTDFPAYMRQAMVIAARAVAARAAANRPGDARACLPALLNDIIAFYRDIAPGSLDQVIAQLARRAQPARERRKR